MQVVGENAEDRAAPSRSGSARRRDAGEITAIQAGLARIIEGTILPSLARSLPRPQSQPTTGPASIPPTPERVAAFAHALIRTEPDEAEVLALANEGLPLAVLLLDLLAPAARHLGLMWEEDEADFVEVTVGLGRLHALARGLCDRLEKADAPLAGRRALLLPCPGETHLFSLAVVASFFREAGWDVVLSQGGDDLVARVRDERFDVVGISLSCDVLLPRMADLIAALRAASSNPGLRVLVGGPLFLRDPTRAAAVGADATAADGRAAVAVVEALLADGGAAV